MSEMVERIGNILMDIGIDDPADQERIARRIIEAMRDPTPELLEAMNEAFGKEPSRDDPMPHYLQRQRSVFVALIDAALGKVDA